MKDPIEDLAETARARRMEVQAGCDAEAVARDIAKIASERSPFAAAAAASQSAGRHRGGLSAEGCERLFRR